MKNQIVIVFIDRGPYYIVSVPVLEALEALSYGDWKPVTGGQHIAYAQKYAGFGTHVKRVRRNDKIHYEVGLPSWPLCTQITIDSVTRRVTWDYIKAGEVEQCERPGIDYDTYQKFLADLLEP